MIMHVKHAYVVEGKYHKTNAYILSNICISPWINDVIFIKILFTNIINIILLILIRNKSHNNSISNIRLKALSWDDSLNIMKKSMLKACN